MPTNPIVFCDFDGTITAEETFVKLVKRFSTQSHAALSAEVANGVRTNAEAVRILVAGIPHAKQRALTDFILAQPLRPGFAAFAETLHVRKIPLVIVSGGLRPLIEARLGQYRQRIHAIHAAELSCLEGRLSVHSAFENNGEILCKRSVLQSYDPKSWVVIGDGANDRAMVAGAETVFARDTLAEALAADGVAHLHFEDFFQIRNVLLRLRG